LDHRESIMLNMAESEVMGAHSKNKNSEPKYNQVIHRHQSK